MYIILFFLINFYYLQYCVLSKEKRCYKKENCYFVLKLYALFTALFGLCDKYIYLCSPIYECSLEIIMLV